MLVNGKWTAKWDPVQKKDKDGRFLRQVSSFRNWITPDGRAGPTGEAGFKAEAGRYHLYVALICPWASRVLIARKLRKLEDVISVSTVAPQLTDEGWRFGGFEGATQDHLFGSTHMHEIYTRADPHYTGRATVPVLWDKVEDRMVNNESADILRMFNRAFDAYGDVTVDLYPADLEAEIDTLNADIYQRLNNGVYRAGFASSQKAHDEAVLDIFAALDALEARLADGREYLFGNRLTETDIRAFVTLVRFDIAYHGLFKTNLKRIADYPHLDRYMKRIYALPGVAETVDFDHIKQGYYSIKALNPSGIVPLGPMMDWAAGGKAASDGGAETA